VIGSPSPVVIGTGVRERLAVVELLFQLGDVTVGGDPDQVGLTLDTRDLAGVPGVPDCSVDPSFEFVRDAVGRRDALLAAVDEWELSGRDDDYLLGGRRLAELDGWSQEGTLRLTSREFDLLAYFMRNRGLVLPREQLLKEVWGERVSNRSRTLEVHIRWLRQKVEPDPAQPTYIQTVRQIGYRFDAP